MHENGVLSLVPPLCRQPPPAKEEKFCQQTRRQDRVPADPRHHAKGELTTAEHVQIVVLSEMKTNGHFLRSVAEWKHTDYAMSPQGAATVLAH